MDEALLAAPDFAISAATPSTRAELSDDALFDGAVRFLQPKHGYRVNADAIVLAAFAATRHYSRVVDLGSGVGVVALTLHHLGVMEQADLVERDPSLAALARENLARAGLPGAVYEADLQAQGLPTALLGQADLVVCNPPYYEPKACRPARHVGELAARSGHAATFIDAARATLSHARARAVFAYPAASLEPFLALCRNAGLHAKRLRLVHPYRSAAARLALFELRRAKPGGLQIEPPLVEWDARDQPSSELKHLLEPRPNGRRR